MEALGPSGVLILSCLVSYAGIGIVVSILNGTDLRPHSEWWYLVRHAKSAVVILAAAVGGLVLCRRIGRERVLLGLLLVMTVSCALILASPWLANFLQFLPPDAAYRFHGWFTDPNEAGLMACLTVCTALAVVGSGRSRVLAMGALLVAVAAGISTYSRTAWLTLILVSLGSLLAASTSVRPKRTVGAVAVVGIAVAVVLANTEMQEFGERQVERWESMYQFANAADLTETTLADRTILWSLALEQTLDAPLLGNGLGRIHALDEAWYNADGALMGAHNQYLVLAGEAGVLPLVLYVLFLVVTLQASFSKNASWPLGAVGGWVIVLTVFSVNFHGILTYRFCNFIIGFICAVTASCSRDEGPRPETT